MITIFVPKIGKFMVYYIHYVHKRGKKFQFYIPYSLWFHLYLIVIMAHKIVGHRGRGGYRVGRQDRKTERPGPDRDQTRPDRTFQSWS